MFCVDRQRPLQLRVHVVGSVDKGGVEALDIVELFSGAEATRHHSCKVVDRITGA